MIAAAAADGRLDSDEQARITANLTQAGMDREAEEFIAREINQPASVDELVAAVSNEREAIQLWLGEHMIRGGYDAVAGLGEEGVSLIEALLPQFRFSVTTPARGADVLRVFNRVVEARAPRANELATWIGHSRSNWGSADLAPLLLKLAKWGSTDPQALRWLDSPPDASIAAALAVALATLAFGFARMPWPHVVLGAGAMLLVAPLLLPRFSDAFVDGPAGLLAPVAFAALATLALAWRVVG